MKSGKLGENAREIIYIVVKNNILIDKYVYFATREREAHPAWGESVPRLRRLKIPPAPFFKEGRIKNNNPGAGSGAVHTRRTRG